MRSIIHTDTFHVYHRIDRHSYKLRTYPYIFGAYELCPIVWIRTINISNNNNKQQQQPATLETLTRQLRFSLSIRFSFLLFHSFFLCPVSRNHHHHPRPANDRFGILVLPASFIAMKRYLNKPIQYNKKSGGKLPTKRCVCVCCALCLCACDKCYYFLLQVKWQPICW